ncbi:MAG TPA: hypothetical protein VLQ89_09370 [Candidatus Binatia bacterium]|nr:hypothetical protein [Candidatus Binatia bacterium]
MASTSSRLKNRAALFPLLLLPAVALGLVSCFSFPVEIPLDPECVIDTLVIVKAIPETTALEEKIVAEPAAASDPNLYALIKVLQVSKPMQLQWHWYSPENKLLRRSKSVEINAKGRYLSYFVAWDAMPQSYYAEKKGLWTVLITADGSFLAKTEFQID